MRIVPFVWHWSMFVYHCVHSNYSIISAMKIWLVWRTNVGKSTLFNRLLWSYRAIVTDVSGTTRELLEEKSIIHGKPVTLIDSPWMENVDEEMQFINLIIKESDILLFVVDGKAELSEQEYRIKDMILAAQKKKSTILVVNKLDAKVYSAEIDMLIADMYSLWFSEVVPISAEQYEGLENLWSSIEDIVKENNFVREKKVDTDWDGTIPLAIIWRPNVGKSTLLNKLVGEKLAHVQDKPWTTLDYITADFSREWKTFKLYDTAGIRKKSKIVWLERIAYSKTTHMLWYVRPIVVIVIDIQEWLTHRDMTLIGEIIQKWLPLILALNKIDLVDPKDADFMVDRIRTQTWFNRIPLVKISWKEGIALPKLLAQISKIYTISTNHISTSKLNKALQTARLTSPPRFPKNKICKWKYISQVDTYPPVFSLSVNNKEYANFSFKRWVEKSLRAAFGFSWVPIKLQFISKAENNPYI